MALLHVSVNCSFRVEQRPASDWKTNGQETEHRSERETSGEARAAPPPTKAIDQDTPDAATARDLFRSVFSESPIGIELYDGEGRLLDANPACLEIFGVSSVDDVRGFRLFEDPNLSPEAKAALQRGEKASYGAPFDFEKVKGANLYPTSRSGVIYLSIVMTPMGAGNKDGAKGYLVQLSEITHERAVQEELRKSEERFRLLAENATDGIYRFRLDPPAYEYVSPAMTTLFGYERDEWLSDPDLDHKIVHPDDQPLIDKMRTPSGELTGPVILRCHHKNGTPIWIEHHNAPIRDESGRIVAIQGIVRDVTERVQSMEDLERLRGEFLGMVTHELKTPLAAIKGSAATALGSSRQLDPEEARELFQIIDEQSDRLRDLADNLLDMSRIEAGSLSVKPEPLALRSAVEEAQSILLRSGRPQRVDVTMPDEMPAVNADRRRLVQVLTNLLTNAAKFSSLDAPIKVRVDHDDVMATVHVQDQGRGITADKLPLLFQKFSQVHDATGTKATGTGLGLAICKGIVESHGGRIWAESAGEGKGATFSFTLPLAGEAIAPSERPAAAPDDNRGRPPQRKAARPRRRRRAAGAALSSALARRSGLSVHRHQRPVSSNQVRRAGAARPDTAGPPPARHQRVRSAGAHPRVLGSAGHLPHRQRQQRRRGPGPEAGRRRLRHEALRAVGAAGAHRSRAEASLAAGHERIEAAVQGQRPGDQLRRATRHPGRDTKYRSRPPNTSCSTSWPPTAAWC